MTTLGEVPTGSLVEFIRWNGEAVVWRIIGKGLAGMPEGSVTLLTDGVIACLPFDASEKVNTVGCTDWKLSNLRQWLNSDKGAGTWYAPQHENDAPPSKENVRDGYNAYDAWAGFLNGATVDEKASLMETTRHFGICTTSNTTSEDGVFLLTITEVGLLSYGGDGTKIPDFARFRQAAATSSCVSLNDHPYGPGDVGESWQYYCATSASENSSNSNVLGVWKNGTASNVPTYEGITGVRPACNLPSDVPVTVPQDVSGHYAVVFDQRPDGPTTSFLGTNDSDGLGWYEPDGGPMVSFESTGSWTGFPQA